MSKNTWVHLKCEVMMFIINKWEVIFDEMAVHVDKSVLSYHEICKHYIEANNQSPIAQGTGDIHNHWYTSLP